MAESWKTTGDVLRIAGKHLLGLAGHEFDLLTVTKPVSPEAAVNLGKVISKLSPLLGNLIEFNTCELLSDMPEFAGRGRWRRQDPGFPDAVFDSPLKPQPGFEIKAWFPLATEITARFKDSQNHFRDDNTQVALIAWLPDNLIYGRPRIVDVCIVSGASVARARDEHYHQPPGYIVMEPEDTTARTRNLQQTNTNGYKFQGTAEQLREAKAVIASWGPGGSEYQPSPNYQAMLHDLMGRYKFRLDTNYAKLDRIVHPDLEEFKTRVLGTEFKGMTVKKWMNVLASEDDDKIRRALERHLDIREADARKLLK